MKNSFFILFFLLVFLSAGFSQKVKIGITAGPVLTGTTRSNIQYNNNNNDSNNHNRTVHDVLSFFGGVVASVPVSNKILFKPQLEYILKGSKNRFDYVDNSLDYDNRIKANCMDLQLNFLYNVPAKNGRFLLGAGPYVSYVLSGTVLNKKTNTTKDLVFNSADSSDINVNRMDVGANIIAEYEFRNGFFCSLNYSIGFRNFRTKLLNEADQNNKNTAVGLGIGYMFK